MQSNQSAPVVKDSGEDSKSGTPKEQFLRTACKRFKICVDQTAKIRQEWLEDVKFANGEQWLEAMLKERADDRRPALTINRLPATHNQVINDFRQNRPAIKVRPVDNLSDPDKADVLNGLYRRIQTTGDYKSAVDTAFKYQVIGSFGFVRVGTKYTNDNSFDQDIFVDRIENPCSVYFPIDLIQNVDYSDAPWCFVRVRIPRDEFKEKYPKIDLQNWNKSGLGDPTWVTEDFVYVAEYFRVEEEEQYLVMLSDGNTVTVKEKVKEGDAVPGSEGLTVQKVRVVQARCVYRSLITEHEVLEEEVQFTVPWIPIVPFLGDEINIDGEKKYISLTRFAKDPQKMFNYWNSAFTEQVALAPKAPWIAAAGQVENYKGEWQNSNNKNIAVLRYDPQSINGTTVPPPQRNHPPEVGMAIIQGIQFAAENIKATTGIFDASLGSKGNETSGKAINARLRQAGTGNFHFADNASKALIHIGRIIKDMIPIIYDTPGRVVRIIGEDMTDKVVELNKDAPAGKLFDMTVGEYDVIVDVGPSYETKRAETVESLMALSQASPAVAQFAPDLLVKNIDFPLRDETAKRLEKGLNIQFPGLIEQEQGKDGMVPQQAVQQALGQADQQIQQAQQTIQQMDTVIQKLSTEIESKDKELQSKMDIEQLRAEVTLLKAQMDLKKTEIQQHHDMVKHGADTALKIHGMHLDMNVREKEAEAAQNATTNNTLEE